MDNTTQLQALMVLGETLLKLRLAEDSNEALAERIAVLESELQGVVNERDRLMSEKGVLLVDVNELEKKIERMKEGEDD